MTTTREVVTNRALSGLEIADLMRQDFDRMLKEDGLLKAHIGYGRVSYDIILRKYLDNPVHPIDESFTHSRPAPPLQNPTDEAIVDGTKLHRKITSPNAERLRTGIPVPIEARNLDGSKTIHEAIYPPDPSIGEGDVAIQDITPETKQAFGIQPTIAAGPVQEETRTFTGAELEELRKNGFTVEQDESGRLKVIPMTPEPVTQDPEAPAPVENPVETVETPEPTQVMADEEISGSDPT